MSEVLITYTPIARAGTEKAGRPAQSTAASAWQVLTTVPAFCAALFLAYKLLPVSYLLVLPVTALAAGLLIRIFIIQHDCGHGSFLRSRRANDRLGHLCSLFTLIPYQYWKRQHALHHATSGDLDRRGHGDMSVYTVDEYLRLTRWQRLNYRVYRNPLVFLLFGPVVALLHQHRFPFDREHTTARQRRSVHITNLTAGLTVAALGWWIGFGDLLLIAAPVLQIAYGAGIWLFYIQHQFEHTYWKRSAEWNSRHAALHGSTYYKLPRILQWFTGNIGFHHLHHLDASIPNYRLEQMSVVHHEYQDVCTVTLKTSLKSAFLSVWDETEGRLISFRALKRKMAAKSLRGAAWHANLRRATHRVLEMAGETDDRKE